MSKIASSIVLDIVNIDEHANNIISAVVSQIISNPCVLFFVVSAYFSGPSWLYIISLNMNKKKKRTLKRWMDNWVGRLLLGAMWEAVIAYFVHAVYFKRFLPITFNELGELMPAVIILALGIQFCIVIAISVFPTFQRRKEQKNAKNH